MSDQQQIFVVLVAEWVSGVIMSLKELAFKELAFKELGVLGYLLGVLGYLLRWRSR